MNKRRLLQGLRKLLVQPDTRIVKRKLQNHNGNSAWKHNIDPNGSISAKNILICLDPRRDNHVSLVIHELLHIFMSNVLRIDLHMNYDLEESAILGWEKSLYDYLRKPKNEKLLESWSNAIQRKLG